MALALGNEFLECAFGHANVALAFALVGVVALDAPVLETAVADAIVNRARMQSRNLADFLDGQAALDGGLRPRQ